MSAISKLSVRTGRKSWPARCAQGPANRCFARPLVGAHQHQVAQVDADDQQNRTNGREKQRQRARAIFP